MKRIKLLFVVLCTAAVGAFAAPNALYFMDILPYQSYQNPAFQPLCNTYVELPGISTISMSEFNGGLSLNDIMYVKDGQLVTFLHPTYGNKDALFAKLHKTTHVASDFDLSILGFGFKVKEHGYFSFNTSLRTDALIGLPKDLFKLGLYGTPDELGVNRFDLSSTRVTMRSYLDVSGGYSHRINDKWTVGGRLHILVGAIGGDMRFDQLYLDASKDAWEVHGKGKLQLSMPGISFTADEDGNFNGIETPSDEMEYLTSYRASMGAALDLGVEYKPLPELSVSLSLKDIGFMYWNNLNVANGAIDGSFDGVYFQEGEALQFADSLLSTITGSLKYDPTAKGYVQEMRGKLYVGAEYSFLRNMMSVGLLSKTEFMSNYVSEEISLNYKIRPCHWFGISAGYSFVSGGWSTLGFAMDLKLPPFNFYVATDYTPLYYSANGYPYKSQAINVQAGVVLTFKTKDNTKRLTAKAADLAAIPEVTAEEPAAEPQTVSELAETEAATEPQAVPELVEGPAEVETSVSNTTVTETVTEKVEEVQGDEVGGTNVVKL